jgi:hypothetical protein
MDPDDQEPTGAVAPESIASRKVTALESRQIVAGLLFELKEVGDDSKFAREAQTAVAQEYHVYNKNK